MEYAFKNEYVCACNIFFYVLELSANVTTSAQPIDTLMTEEKPLTFKLMLLKSM